MPERLCNENMRVMDAEPVTKLVLEIHSSAAPIQGCLRDAAGEGQCFTGWLGLAAALERALHSPDSPAGDHPSPD